MGDRLRKKIVVMPSDEPPDRLPGAGRPAHIPTESSRHSVCALAAMGMQQDNIARVIRVSPGTLLKYYRHELTSGKELSNGNVAVNMYAHAMGRGKEAVEAGKFWLTSQAGWRPTQRMEHTGENGDPIGVAISVGPLTDEERGIKLLQFLNKLRTRGIGLDTAVGD